MPLPSQWFAAMIKANQHAAAEIRVRCFRCQLKVKLKGPLQRLHLASVTRIDHKPAATSFGERLAWKPIGGRGDLTQKAGMIGFRRPMGQSDRDID